MRLLGKRAEERSHTKSTNLMSDERKRIEIGLGEKGTVPDDAKPLESVKPGGEEVEGHYHGPYGAQCPHCWTICEIPEETDYRIWIRCWNCGNPFLY